MRPDGSSLVRGLRGDAVVKVMKEHPELKKVRVEGHTDTRGAAPHNQKLSQIRSEAVQKYLVDHGIEAKRLTAKGFGASRPLVTPEKGDDDYQKNRRVEFVIVEQTEAAAPAAVPTNLLE